MLDARADWTKLVAEMQVRCALLWEKSYSDDESGFTEDEWNEISRSSERLELEFEGSDDGSNDPDSSDDEPPEQSDDADGSDEDVPEETDNANDSGGTEDPE